MAEPFHHRSGLKKSNKPFKGKSKGKANESNKGKVEKVGIVTQRSHIKSRKADGSKLNRENKSKQLQKIKRAEVIASKRLGSGSSSSKIVAVIPLDAGVSTASVMAGLLNHVSSRFTTTNPSLHSFTTLVNKHEEKYTIYDAGRSSSGDPLIAAMDAAKVADLIVFVTSVSGEEGAKVEADALGQRILRVLKAQGMPPVLGTVQGLLQVPQKKRSIAKKLQTDFFHFEFGEDIKVVELDKESDFLMLLRFLKENKLKAPTLREHRSYLLAERCDMTTSGELTITGYLRGKLKLSPNHLVHLTGFGDFALSQIEQIVEERERRSRQNSVASQAGGAESASSAVALQLGVAGAGAGVDVLPPGVVSIRVHKRVLGRADEGACSLEELRPVDLLAHEQSVITEEEIRRAQKEVRNERIGGGDAPSLKEVWGDIVSDEEDDDKAKGISSKSATASQAGDMEDDEDAESSASAKKNLERDDMQFPDEVATPREVPARVRFARYRGLKSLKHSAWDPKESLPLNYSRIFHFEDFQATRKEALHSSAGPAEPEADSRVVLHLRAVPPAVAAALCQRREPVTVWPLLAHEHKVSVMHFLVRRQPEFEGAVRGKDAMVVQCGFRRSLNRPVYSQQTQGCSKHVVERFLQAARFSVASVYARVMFAPAPVLLFAPEAWPAGQKTLAVEDVNAVGDFVAAGSLMDANPYTLLVKRIVLTGYPVNVQKRSAVVRHMFWHPEDIRWFKPVELWTKFGLAGHIREPRGTKGLMKCSFDSFIKNHDTVCMSLYKRQFPPWPEYFIGPVEPNNSAGPALGSNLIVPQTAKPSAMPPPSTGKLSDDEAGDEGDGDADDAE